ncbi:Oidioi.mRNA.OKI2018_I69.chr2.g5099.t1.cds [Oikopleura dioica]|uniref:Oidioi.mRNA.OKI2018_I69.chr2.g5099.t1.cds n=1 Tax=Oikopleura dioica TaxID=34765 RepID=A0ABN7T3Q9_OIKDI|nr:Oidioi.mRNA.OKI2018_I69.chr2.g5099.t1.cds [Oikopleura dioica]
MEIAGTRYCGTEIPDVDGFIAPLTVNFVSDGSVNREGFQLFYFLEERSGSGDLIPGPEALFGLATVYSFNSIYTQTLLYALNIHEIRTTRIRRLGSQSTMNPLKHLPRHKFKSRFNRRFR